MNSLAALKISIQPPSLCQLKVATEHHTHQCSAQPVTTVWCFVYWGLIVLIEKVYEIILLDELKFTEEMLPLQWNGSQSTLHHLLNVKHCRIMKWFKKQQRFILKFEYWFDSVFISK